MDSCNTVGTKSSSFSCSSSAGSTRLALPKWRKYTKYIYYAILIVYLFARRVSAATEEVNGGEEKIIGRYKVANFNFDHVSDVYAITLWILLGSLAKVGKFSQQVLAIQKIVGNCNNFL